MKKYKLIKCYPGSEELGTIATEENSTTCYNTNGFLHYSSADFKQNIEKYPEFWQEIVEKEYEILSFKDKYSNLIVYQTNLKHLYQAKNRGMKVSLDFCLNKAKEYWDIHSVKRLSDGEIFTIGDKVKCWSGIHEIKHIFLLDKDTNKIRFWMKEQIGVENVPNDNNPAGFKIDSIEKSKTPLFTTEDGVDIFDGDTYLENYNSNDKYEFSNYQRYRAVKDGEEDYSISNSNCLRFSSKEAAEAYIIVNKPCLSINDVENFKSKHYSTITKLNWLDGLKELVKTKL